MDLRAYYQKLREIESKIVEPFVVVVSRSTPDGGRDGVKTETPRGIAARMIADGTARQASEEEAAAFREEAAEAKRLADEAAKAGRLQVTVVSEGAPKKQSSTGKSPKT